MQIFLGGDHAGFDLKEQLEAYLMEAGHEVKDLGNTQYDEQDDYPDWAHPVAQTVVANDGSRGILLCGNAEGVCIVANKTKGVRAALGFSAEATKRARQDDDVNILCLPGRMMDLDEAKELTDIFLTTDFAAKERYVRRLQKLAAIEEKTMK